MQDVANLSAHTSAGAAAIGAVASAAWPPTCWVVSDGRAGTENQSVGLAEAMGLTPVIKQLRMHRRWREFGLALNPVRRYIVEKNGIGPPWPDMLIGTGRTCAMASLYIKQASGGRTYTVQNQIPPIYIGRFNCVIVPEHDRYSRDNVITVRGGLHRITPDLLRREAAVWAPRFAHLPRPYVAVLLGGASATYRLGVREIAAIGETLAGLAQDGRVGLLITSSRRTGAANIETLRALLRGCPAQIWDGTGANPYYGMLGLADSFIVTCDSINMMSEACSTGKPVHMIKLPPVLWLGHSRKYAAFQRSLIASGHIRAFNGALEHWRYAPLREMERVAMLVREGYLAHAQNR